MPPITVAIVNHSSLPEVARRLPQVCAALQKQVSRDFAPVWGTDAALRLMPAGGAAAAAEWQLLILDDTDQAFALGYHGQTDDGALPQGKVFARTALRDGRSWSCTASHELLEMLADPWGNLSVVTPGPEKARLLALEVCDPCSADAQGYDIDGVRVSDFVFPAWFQYRRKTGPFDQCGHLKAPLTVLPGSSIDAYDIRNGRGWFAKTA